MPNNRNTSLRDLVGIISNISSLIVAVVAIYISIQSENRSQQRFQLQLDQSREIAQANIKPLIEISHSGYEGVKKFVLSNNGLGTAIIRRIEFINEVGETTNLALSFRFEEKFLWDDFYQFSNTETYLRPGETKVLVSLTNDNLRNQGFSSEAASAILKSFDDQVQNIKANIVYEDLLGNLVGDFVFTL